MGTVYAPVNDATVRVLTRNGFAVVVPAQQICCGALASHALAMALTLASAVLLRLTSLRQQRDLQPRDGFLLVTLVWTVLPAFGTLPLLLQIEGLSFTDAYFEAVSGLTTTGGTVLTGLEKLAVSINVWRCFMVLIGGMGIIVLTVAIPRCSESAARSCSRPTPPDR